MKGGDEFEKRYNILAVSNRFRSRLYCYREEFLWYLFQQSRQLSNLTHRSLCTIDAIDKKQTLRLD